MTASAGYLIGVGTLSTGTACVISVGSSGGSQNSAGDAIIVGGSASGTATVSGVTDSAGNTYSEWNSNAAENPTSGWIADGSNNPGGVLALGPTGTITATFSSSTGTKIAGAVGCPGASASPVDQNPTPTSNAGSASPSITSSTLAQPVEVGIGIMTNGNAGGETMVWDSGWTSFFDLFAGSGGQVMSMAAKTTSSTGAVTAGGTITSTKWCMLLITLKTSIPAVTTSSLPGGTTGTSYSQTLGVSGGYGGYTWSLSSGSLPAGLSLNSSTGAIAGTPQTAGTSSFTAKVTDGNGNTATQPLSVTITSNLTVATSSLPGGSTGSAYSQTLGASGGYGSYTWSLSSGSLPAGLSLNASTGAVTGTARTGGTFSFTAQVTDAGGNTASQPLSITVASNLVITTSSLPNGSLGISYSQALAASGGYGSYTWSVLSGTLPGGLSLSSGGTLSGIPAAGGSFSFTTGVTDAGSNTATAGYSVTVSGFPLAPLDVAVELDLGGTWTDITAYAYQREGTSAPITITRGRSDETAQATPASCAMEWNNRDGRFSPRNPTGPYFGLLGRNTPLRVSVPDSGTYLRLADDAVSYASCPDSSALRLTGNIDARIDMWLDDYQACALAGKWGASSAAQAWCLVLNADGTLTWWWNDGTSVRSTRSSQPLPYTGRVMIRCFFQASAGQVTFWTAPDMSGTQTQLGSAVAITTSDYAQGAPGQAVGIGWVPGFAGQGITSTGCLGKIYEFALYSATPTLAANPQFWDQTPGAPSFADAQGNTWTLAGTSELSARSFRGHFECSSLPQQWDPTGTDVWTPVRASGVLRRLAQGNAPVPSVMRRGVTGDIAVNYGVQAYWPCEDPQGATSIASGLPGTMPMLFSATPGFQGQSGSPSADSIFACSAQLPQVGTSAWLGAIPAYTPSGGPGGLFFLAGIPSDGLSAGAQILSVAGPDANAYLSLEYATAGNGTLSVDVGGLTSISGPGNVNGTALWIELSATSSQSVLTVLAAGAVVPASYTTATGISGTFSQVAVNRLTADLGETEFGQIFFCAVPPAMNSYAALLAAYTGETDAARVARLCAENGLASRVYGFPAASAVMGAQTVDTLANLLQYCETTGRGMLYEPSETLGIGYRTLHSMCAQPAAGSPGPAVLASYTAAVLGGDGSQGLVPVDDDQYTVNDATVSRNNGSSYQVQVTSGALSISPPPDGTGDYATQITVYCAYDTQLPGIAGWVTWIGTADEERYPVIPFNLARPQLSALVYDIQDARLGDWIQITSPPAWLPPGPIDQLVFGTTEKLGGYFWQIAWNAVPETPYETLVLDDGTFGHLGTDGSALASAVSPSATTLAVATTSATSPLWSTSGADDPFGILISGEQITVTAVTAGAAGTATSPAAYTTLASIALAEGSYAIAWQVTLSGTLSGNETSNFQLSLGAAYLVSSVNADAAGTYTQAVYDLTVPSGGGTLHLQSSARAATSGAVYAGKILNPQAFTVTRSVNGVVKAQAAGAAVALFRTPVLALA